MIWCLSTYCKQHYFQDNNALYFQTFDENHKKNPLIDNDINDNNNNNDDDDINYNDDDINNNDDNNDDDENIPIFK